MAAFQTFHEYMGSGLIVIWYLAALIWLFLKEEKRPVRIALIYLPCLILFLFFNPIFYAMYDRFMDGETYFRLLWLLPMVVTLAYTVISIARKLCGKKRTAFGMAALFLAIVTGTCVYSNPLFSRAENVYHVPAEVVEICDKIQIEGREVMAAFPVEFLLYVRQYTEAVCMPYGRENMQGTYDEFYSLMLKKDIPVEEMALYAKAARCHYIIISTEKNLIGDPEAYDYEFFGQVGEYLIYRDPTQDFRNTME